MSLTAAQLVTLATQEAKCPGFTSQAGQFLNQTLEELCEDYDVEQARGFTSVTFNSGTVTLVAGGTVPSVGSGPYALPADYLRARVQDGKDMVIWSLNGVPYPLIQITYAEYLWLVQTPGFTAYPQNYATDRSLKVYTTPVIYVWPPASLQSTPLAIYYQRLMPDITTPETSSTVPWFPNSTVLQRSVAGRLMGITGDSRMEAYLGDDPEKSPMSWKTLLNNWLKNADDREGAAKTVGLDRRRFNRPFDALRNTKQVGW